MKSPSACKRCPLCSVHQNRGVPLSFSSEPAWTVGFTNLLFLVPGAETWGRQPRAGALLQPGKQRAAAAGPGLPPRSWGPPGPRPFPSLPPPAPPHQLQSGTVLPDLSPRTHPRSREGRIPASPAFSGRPEEGKLPSLVPPPSPLSPIPSSLLSTREHPNNGDPCALIGGASFQRAGQSGGSGSPRTPPGSRSQGGVRRPVSQPLPPFSPTPPTTGDSPSKTWGHPRQLSPR